MKIAYIASGAGGMYCGTCLRDNTLAAALLRNKIDVTLIPMYTPMRTDEENVSMPKIFYGGINVYLQQEYAFFRHSPAVLDRWLDHPSLLKLVSRKSASTDAKDLGPLTISVLRGEEGRQKKELAKLVTWLKELQPDLIHLTNSMFSGFAREMKRQLNVPVVCSLQGEDLFLQDLIEPYRSEAMRVLRERAQEVDAFIAPSNYYANFMSELLRVPPEKIHVVKLGLNLTGHGPRSDAVPKRSAFEIGFLARICPEKGLHLLVDAFLQLAKESDEYRLKIAGYLGKKDEAYCRDLLAQIESAGLKDRCEFRGEVSRDEKIRFLNSIDVLSVPTTYCEPKGLFVLEAWANGVPVVQPQHGAFPEMLEATGGGILVAPHSAEAVAEGIRLLKNDPELRRHMGERGRRAVQESYNDQAMADAAMAVFRKYATSA